MVKPDRRVERTRHHLHKALIELLTEKQYDQITVQDILDRANIGRATFYAHFTDKNSLLLDGLDEEHFQIPIVADDPQAAADEFKLLPSYTLFRHAQQFHPLYKAMLGGHGIELVKTAFHKHLIHTLEHRLKRHIPDLTIPLPVASHYLAGALMSLVIWWLDAGMPYSPQEMDTMFHKIAMTGLEQLSRE